MSFSHITGEKNQILETETIEMMELTYKEIKSYHGLTAEN